MTLEEVRVVCVEKFPSSKSRSSHMAVLEAVVTLLRRDRIPCEIWVDGSFVTDKVNPEDIDLVVQVEASFYEVATREQRECMDWISAGSERLRCDSYLFVDWPSEHPQHDAGQRLLRYWLDQFGRDGHGNVKGMAVVVLGET